MKKALFVLIVAAILVAAVALTGCDSKVTAEKPAPEPVNTTIQTPSAKADVPELDTSSFDEEVTWPPVLDETEEEPLMAEVDAIMRDNWVALESYKNDHGEGEVELYYSASERGSISDVVVMNLKVLAHNGWNEYVEKRVKELRSYNKAFAATGGEVPEWAEDELKEVESFVK
jgi:hypothetical protein